MPKTASRAKTYLTCFLPSSAYIDPADLERYIVVADWCRMFRFRHTLIHVVICSAAAAGGIATAGSAIAAAQQDQVCRNDVRHVFLLLGLRIFPGVRLQPALDVDLAALFQVFS